MEKEKKEYTPLPTLEAIEGLILVEKLKTERTLDFKIPKITEEEYIEWVKYGVDGYEK